VRSDDGDVQRAAIVGLGLAKRSEALPILLDAVIAADPATRLVALAALAELDAPQVVAALRRAAIDGDESVRLAAVEHLAARKSAAATDALINLLAEPTPRERVVAALALPADGRIASIMQALETASESTAPLLIAALTRAQRTDANAALVGALEVDNVFARRAAAEALGQTRFSAARAALEHSAVNDPDSEVRRLSSLALGD
jgi:HEAT repeat protein